MKIDVSRSGNGARISISGSMYVEDSASVREKLDSASRRRRVQPGRWTSGLDYVDSSGLGVLISIHKRCLQKGGKMTITGLRGMVEELFKLTRLDLVFNVAAH